MASPATVKTYFYYGSGPSEYILDDYSPANLRFNTADDNDQDTDNKMVVPSSGDNYSFWKHIALVAESAPDNAINNIKFYTDGTVGWGGCTIKSAQVTNYDEATGTESTTGDDANSSHTDAPTMTDISTYTSESPLSVTGDIASATGKIIDGYLLLQVTVDTGATAGNLSSETLTWQYDES